MTVTKEQVRDEINASTATVSDDKINLEIAVATAMVNRYMSLDGSEYATDEILSAGPAVPPEVYAKAVLLVTVEAINQALAPNGVLNQSYDIGTGDIASTPVRIGRDPLKPAYAVLDPWLSGRFFCA